MVDVLSIIAPVFGLIALGFLFGRLGWLSTTAEKGVSEFAFTLAVPALLFKTIVTMELGNVSIAGVWLSFYGAISTAYILSVVGTAFLLKRPQKDGASIAMSAVFGNAVMLGIPISLQTYGNAAAAPLALILSVHAPSLWLATTLHAQLADQSSGFNASKVAFRLFDDLSHNPIVIGIVAGGLWRLFGFTMPDVGLKILGLLAQAGVPAALVALGLSLVRFQIKGQVPTLTMIVCLKLLVMPLVAFTLGYFVFDLDPVSLGVVSIVAAAPTGANAYLFATKNGRAINSASGAVALGTVLSSITIAILLSVIKP